jgi:hypothetical protein
MVKSPSTAMLMELAVTPRVVSPDTTGNAPNACVTAWLIAVRFGGATVPAAVLALAEAAGDVPLEAADDVPLEAVEVPVLLELLELQALARPRPTTATSTGATVLSCLFMPLPPLPLG